MSDPFANDQRGLGSPIANCATVTPNDGTDLTTSGRGLWVDVTGNVKFTTVNGDTDTLSAVAAGVWHPIRIRRVWATGTTATGIHIGY